MTGQDLIFGYVVWSLLQLLGLQMVQISSNLMQALSGESVDFSKTVDRSCGFCGVVVYLLGQSAIDFCFIP